MTKGQSEQIERLRVLLHRADDQASEQIQELQADVVRRDQRIARLESTLALRTAALNRLVRQQEEG